MGAQVEALTAAGAATVFRKAARGALSDRAQFHKVLAALEDGDVLVVTRLDWLAESTRGLLKTLTTIARCKACFRSPGDTWADTTTLHGPLMLTVFGGLAKYARELIRVRTSEGRARAVARSVKLGRKPKLTQHQLKEIRRGKAVGEAAREIAHSYNAHNSTLSKLAA